MPRKLSPEEAALWARVVETVAPLDRSPAERDRDPPPPGPPLNAPPKSPRKSAKGPGTTLDSHWDRKLARGQLEPDRVIDLHGHSLDGAYQYLDRGLASAIAGEARLVLLITGHPPKGRAPIERGRIRAAVGDWLDASRHAGHIAAIRPAHQRHGGRGALYLVLRRRR
ncbi:MAG: Smr/MutS family protein [Sphingomonadales bacterium]|nr:Smr/MutS family protein [Sphingomonadales bacterium]